MTSSLNKRVNNRTSSENGEKAPDSFHLRTWIEQRPLVGKLKTVTWSSPQSKRKKKSAMMASTPASDWNPRTKENSTGGERSQRPPSACGSRLKKKRNARDDVSVSDSEDSVSSQHYKYLLDFCECITDLTIKKAENDPFVFKKGKKKQRTKGGSVMWWNGEGQKRFHLRMLCI